MIDRIRPGSVPAAVFVVGAVVGIGGASFVPSAYALGLLGSIVLGVLLALWKKYWSVVFWLSAVGFGCALWFQVPRSPSLTGWYPPVNGTFQGAVVNIIRQTPTMTRCVVQGQLALQGRSSMSASMLLTVLDTITIQPGSRISTTVRVRPLRPPQLFTDMDEVQLGRRYQVQWVGVTLDRGWTFVQNPLSTHSFYSLRKAVQRRIDTLFDEVTAPLFRAMLTGDKSQLSYEQRQIFQLTGTAHVFAVSGFHVGIIAVVLYTLLLPLRGSWWFFLGFAAGIIGFVLLTGGHPSTIRAAAMALLFAGLILLERTPHFLNVIAAVAIGVVLVDPTIVFDVGFQLSFAAVTGIALLHKPIMDWLRRLMPRLSLSITTMLAVSLAASLAVAPLTAFYFHQFAWIAPLANLLVLPLISVAMIFAFCALLSSFVSWVVAQWYAATATMVMETVRWGLQHIVQLGGYVQGPLALVLALLSVAGLVSLVTARGAVKFLMGGLILLGGLVIALNLLGKNKTPIVASRDAVVLVVHPQSSRLMLHDRRPLFPLAPWDVGLVRYLSMLPDTMTVYAAGPQALYYAQFIPSIDTVWLPSLLFSTERFWYAVDTFDARRIPLVVVPDTVWYCGTRCRYSLTTNVLQWQHSDGDTVLCLPQLRIGEMIEIREY